MNKNSNPLQWLPYNNRIWCPVLPKHRMYQYVPLIPEYDKKRYVFHLFVELTSYYQVQSTVITDTTVQSTQESTFTRRLNIC